MAVADTESGWFDVEMDVLKRSVSGVFLMGAGAMIMLSALSYNPADSSFDTAGLLETSGLLAGLRTTLANFGLQALGWGALVLGLLMAFWGFRGIFFPIPKRSKWQAWSNTALILLTVMFSSAALSAAPIPVGWPFATGMGGMLGDKVFFGLSGLLSAFKIPAAGGFAAVLAVMFAGLFGGVFLRLRGTFLWEIWDALGLVWATLRVWADALWAKVSDMYARRQDKDSKPVKAWLDPAELGEPEAQPAVSDKDDDSDGIVIQRAAPEPAPKPATKKAPKPKKPKFKFPKNADYQLPTVDLLKTPPPRSSALDEGQLERNAEELSGVLEDFGVKGDIVGVNPGPVVTLYEFEPAPGVKSSRVINLADDIARSMSAISARVAVVPGRNAIGIELPNRRRETVWLRSMLASKEFEQTEHELPLLLGETIGGQPYMANLAKMPHLLVAGTTGSGKSVAVNAMILSLMYKLTPEECKFIMIDPKMLELSIYDGAPHLLAPVVTEPKKAVVALKWTVREMESRYRKMSKLGVRNVAGYNERVAEALKTGESLSRTVQTGYDKESGEPIYETEEIIAEPMPFIVVIIDEMADLMMVAGKEIEGAVQRLAQMARAAGIHMIMATQRPSVDVITGTIKANFPTRISFQVTSKIDSRTILGEQGAEQLLGMGDMLYMAGGGRTRRLHGPFISDNEVEHVAAFVKAQGTPAYLEDITKEEDEDEPSVEDMMNGDTGDETFDKAVAIVASDRKVSTSYIQRRLSIGYNRAANIVEMMEAAGMIGPAGPGGKREIFLPEHQEY